MKLYVKSSKTVEETPWRGYCTYTAVNPTWGYDSYRYLKKSGGEKGYVKFPKPNGEGYYRPEIIYLFPNESSYETFNGYLVDSRLSWHIETGPYRELSEGVVIIREGY